MKNQHELRAYQLELEKTIEELRKSQNELEASRNTYAFLYDFAPVGYFTFDRHGVIRSVNLTGEQLLGIPTSRLLRQRFDALIVREGRNLFAVFLQTVFSSLNKETCRLQLISQKQPLYVRIEAQVTLAGHECLAVLVDITEKKQAEQALAESGYYLAKAQAMTHVGSWSLNPHNGQIQASAELLRILRLEPEETNREAFASVVHPDDYENVMRQLQLGAEKGNNYEIEHRLLFPDGSERWVYSIIEPMREPNGHVHHLYGTTQDITERKRAEVELQNKTNELQAIFDSINDGIMVYDQSGHVQHHNQISPQLFPGKTTRGLGCSAIFHPEEPRDPDDCPVERALKGESIDISLTVNQEGQPSRYLDITATPIRDALGEKHRALVFLRDVSEKRLQEMRLIQSEKMSSIGVLATGIAHEINNPLSSIAGFAEALQRRFRGETNLLRDSRLEDFPHYLETIISESYRCKGIINNLLSFARKSDGLQVQVDFNQILQETLALLRHHSTYHKIQVKSSLQEHLPLLRGDSSGLRQVCMNLLVNAFQAIEKEGCVAVQTRTISAGQIALIVTDSGCGMTQQVIERIWEPFFTTKEVGKGTGLGLALTYNIVKQHGGEIHLTSQPGEGSTFTVLLPAAR